MENIDLHNHSIISDGLMTPSEVVRLAHEGGVTMLALTDHDDVSGLVEAKQSADELGIAFITGVEISVSWRKRTIHLLGLNIDPDFPPLIEGLSVLREGRTLRAEYMGKELARAGISGALEGAKQKAHNPSIISRSHFARFLVDKGYAKDTAAVFKKFLVPGKVGYVAHEWVPFSEAIDWVLGAGGVPVIAHPGRYKLGINVLSDLLDEAVSLGVQGLEVVTGNHSPEQTEWFADECVRRHLLASRGSDFHGLGESRCLPGRLPDLPPRCAPVWQVWSPQISESLQ
jgi:hypothetical protein